MTSSTASNSNPAEVLGRSNAKVQIPDRILRFLGIGFFLYGLQFIGWAFHNAYWEVAAFVGGAGGVVGAIRITYDVLITLAVIAVGALTAFCGLSAARGVAGAFALMKRLNYVNAVLVVADITGALLVSPDLVTESGPVYPFVTTVSPTLQIPFMVVCPPASYAVYVVWLRVHPWIATTIGVVGFFLLNRMAFWILDSIERRTKLLCPACGGQLEFRLSDLGAQRKCDKCGDGFGVVWEPPPVQGRGRFRRIVLPLLMAIACAVWVAMRLSGGTLAGVLQWVGVVPMIVCVMLLQATSQTWLERVTVLVLSACILHSAWLLLECQPREAGLLALAGTLGFGWLSHLAARGFVAVRLSVWARRTKLTLCFLGTAFLALAALTCGAITLNLQGIGPMFTFVAFLVFMALCDYPRGAALSPPRPVQGETAPER